ncbi:MAG: response regulator [Rhodocyclaceae bacterium]|nr:response regulator [Rhodocyclaceae bacterium]
MNILLVDSTPLYRDILQQSFGRARGVRILHEATQKAALSRAGLQTIDFFILSGQLPDGNGQDLARELRQSGCAQVAPIVLLTASPSAELARQAMLAGVTELFRKQDVEELITFVRHFLNANQPMHGRVLYVEDVRTQRDLMVMQLCEWGLMVDAFENADQAWEAFAQAEYEYDLVLTDLILGGHMSGSRLINRIRRHALPKGATPILALTAFDNPSRRIELFHLGIDDYVLKPVIPIELRARLQSLLSRKRASQHSQQLLEATSLGVTVVDEEGFVRTMDVNARTMFGVAEEMVEANSVKTLLGDVADKIVTALQQGAPLNKLRYTARHSTGSVVQIELSSLEVESANGWRQFALLTRDVSKELELANYLMRAKDAAENASRVKAEFLANMSHEIRTPLNAIIGMAYLMQRNGLSPDQAERAGRITRAGQHLLGIISDVLDISKIEAGRLSVERVPVSVADIVANVVAMVAEQASAKGLQLIVKNDDLPANLLGDPTRLTQSLLNYVANAIKFTEQGSITLSTRVQHETEQSVTLYFSVSDTGMGIEANALEQIFAAFQQADSSTTRKFGGTGLGLSITRELARLMDGDAGASSVPGQGSLFWFTATLKRGQAKEPPVLSQHNIDAEQVLGRDFGGTHILLAEDDFINRELALGLLANLNFQIDVAQDGLMAVDMVQKNDYGLVLMDMQMPHMGGLEATQKIRALPGRRLLPIIAMTANTFAEDRKRCFDAGMNDFIPKPIDPDLLFEKMLHWLSASKRSLSA